jgi:hypothetical protein
MKHETTFEGAQTQTNLTRSRIGIIGIHAFIGWALCTATMVIGMATMSIENALIVHAVGAPIIFTAVSLSYFKRYNYTSPLATAEIFVGFVIFMDFFLVSMLVMKSFEMFTSLLGTWIPFTLIFISTAVTGLLINKGSKK